MAIYPDSWNSANAYARNATVEYSGIQYRALEAVAANTATNPSESDSWEANASLRVYNHLSLLETARIYINQPSNDRINDSMPQFLQMAEQDAYQMIHPPAQRQAITRTVMAPRTTGTFQDLPYITLPGNIDEFIHVRQLTETNGSNPGSIEFVEADTSRFWQTDGTNIDTGRVGEGLGAGATFIEPVYLYDNENMYFAGSELETNDSIELFVELAIPQLGTTTQDSNGDDEVVTSNWYSTNAHRPLLYGTLVHASAALKDPEQSTYWKQLYEESVQEVLDYLERFESSDKTAQYMGAEDYFR